MTTAYIRTSTVEQDGAGQRNAILEWAAKEGRKVDKWETEQISSRKAVEERRIAQVVGNLRKGDTLVVSELSRLGRSSITEVGSIIEMIRKRGASLSVVRDNLHIEHGEPDLMTQAMLSALLLAGRIERDMISERTRSALKARKESGVKLGRPEGSKLEEREPEIRKYLGLGLNKSSIAKLLGVSRTTLYAYLDRQGTGRRK